MSTFKIDDLVYIPPFNYSIVYDIDRPKYKIVAIESYITAEAGIHPQDINYTTSYKYMVETTEGIKPFDEVRGVPNIQLTKTNDSNFKVNIQDFKIDDKTIKKIEENHGDWVFVDKQGWRPPYPNRHKYTLSDNSVVESEEYTITKVNVMPGGRSRTIKNKYKKSRKLRRKTNRRR